MPSFVVIEANVRDPAARDRYAAMAGPILKEYGGVTVAFGPWHDLSGRSDHRMGMIIQFEDRTSAMAWYDSPGYQGLISLRNEGLDCRFRLLG